MDFFPEIPIDAPQAEAMARGLFAVAKADGMHPQEQALIASFYTEVGGTARGLAELERMPAIAPAELAAALQAGEQRKLFVKTALLLAWADGEVSAAERNRIGEYAQALSVGGEEMGRLEASVKEYLLQQLSHLKNADAAAQVAARLKL
jgi:tellurite resistance protein